MAIILIDDDILPDAESTRRGLDTRLWARRVINQRRRLKLVGVEKPDLDLWHMRDCASTMEITPPLVEDRGTGDSVNARLHRIINDAPRLSVWQRLKARKRR